VHVVRLVRGVRDEGVELPVGVGDLQRDGGREHRRVVQVVARQVGQQRLHPVDRVLLVGGQVVRVAGAGVVGTGAAELLEADLLAGHRLDHVRPGDEHVAGPVDHDGEVGDRRRVDRAAGARAHHQRDLRDHAGGAGVAVEDLPVEAQRHHALLDPGAAGVVDADDRASDPHRQVHHLDDLLAEHLPERPAEDGEVLREDRHLAAVDRAVPGDHAVAVRAVGSHAEVGGPVAGELVQLHERARVEQHRDPLPGRLLAPGVLLLHRPGGAGVDRLLDPAVQVGDLARGGADVGPAGVGRGHAGIRLGHAGDRSRAPGRGTYGGPVGAHPGRVRLPVAELRRAVITAGGPWTRLDVVDSTGSTNDDLVAAARAGEPEGRVLVAEHQRAGRGRSGRRWVSPPRAGLAVSVLLRPGGGTAGADPAGPPVPGAGSPGAGPAGAPSPGAGSSGGSAGVPTSRWGWLPMLAGVALVEAVGRVTGLDPALKWPNDVLVDGRKCAGILAEATGDAVVVGVGVNVTLRGDELPPVPPGAPPATSLALAGAACTDRARLLRDLLDRLGSWYGRWRDAAGDADRCGLRAAYLAVCDTVGRAVRVQLPGGGELVGRAETVD